MYHSKICLLYLKQIKTFQKQALHTNGILLFRKKANKKFKESSMSKRNNLDEYDSDNIYNSDDEDIAGETFDFMNLDKSYDDSYREQEQWKDRVKKVMAVSKFFSGPREPSMLTYNERQCVKYLNEQDPVQWDINTLSEAFPATPEGIKALLRSRWKPTPEKIKKIDVQVQKNWQALENGTLDADPKAIEHFQKFINRREVLLEQIKNANFYLPEIKKEKVWNNGEMSSILQSYENLINKLCMEQTDVNNKSILDGKASITDGSSDEIKKTSLELLRTKISAEAEKYNSRKESFFLSEMVKTFSQPVTIDELQKSVLLKAEANEQLNLSERAILDSKLSRNSYNNKTKNARTLNFENNEEEKQTKKSNRDVRLQKIVQNKTTSVYFNEDNDKASCHESYEDFNSLIENNDLKPSQCHLPEEIIKNTNFITECNIPEALVKSNEINKEVESLDCAEIVKKPTLRQLSIKRFNELMEGNPERQKKDELYYEKEVSDIRHTCFWNNKKNNTSKAMLEFEKKPLEAPDDTGASTKPDFYENDKYPERIKIPKGKKGCGVIFKVRDCYYDDDGEFLYRVPGMVK